MLFRFSEDLESVLDSLEIVSIANTQDVPAVSQESCFDILGKGDARVPLDRDVIVVVNPAKVIETEVSGERGRFRCNSFHQAAVAADCVYIIVEDVEAGTVITIREPFLGNRHSDTRGNTLPERTRRRFYS